MLKLYYAPNTCALASHLALEQAGAPYETVRLSFETQDQRGPDYLGVNPKGRVPALETSRGILTETPAILAFVAQSFPAARLAPLDDAFAFAQGHRRGAALDGQRRPLKPDGSGSMRPRQPGGDTGAGRARGSRDVSWGPPRRRQCQPGGDTVRFGRARNAPAFGEP
jgi:hypothetical protein